MCYAIPGKVVGIKEGIVTVDYFGEKKKARNEFYELNNGDYVYVQGGFIIQKISEREALPVLDSWKKLFFKLKEIDFRLAGGAGNKYRRANALRQKYHGNSCCIHGIIEFSNYCRSNCFYCGIRKDNSALARYRMEPAEIIKTASYAVNELGFKALVLQSGEDTWYDEKSLSHIVTEIRKKAPCLIILSLGEREEALYRRLYDDGARGALLRFETGRPDIYEKLRPGRILKDRLELIKKLKDKGYLVMTGFLIGLPGQSGGDILNDIKLTSSLDSDMFSFGPLIPHPATPLAGTAAPSVETVLEAIADARLDNPRAQILVNTSFETLDAAAIRNGLMAGANSLMINVTPEKYRKFYDIYPHRAGIDLAIKARIGHILSILHSIGRAPTDLGL
ncbi:MAG: HypC/HybG/HupF family hydrogenase formation chaperone [Candidatus Omnitrophica bacterium]|nr:HypC/HybG/HupF family hydrogenase formation chaperone [Candidatus Omnitrophota bacterium]